LRKYGIVPCEIDFGFKFRLTIPERVHNPAEKKVHIERQEPVCSIMPSSIKLQN
jgi:hypothetical protein